MTTTFELGDFFGRHVRWMSPLMTLYAADFFEISAALVIGVAPALEGELRRALIDDLPHAVAPHPHDLTPFMRAAGGQRRSPEWSQFLLDCKTKYPEPFSRYSGNALRLSGQRIRRTRTSTRSKIKMHNDRKTKAPAPGNFPKIDSFESRRKTIGQIHAPARRLDRRNTEGARVASSGAPIAQATTILG